MKKFFLLVFLVAFSALSNKKEEAVIGTTNIHVPRGFDANDFVSLIITGELPSTCWLRPYGEVKEVNGRIIIITKAWKVSDPEATCITAQIPYMISVNLGNLKQGYYPIVVNPNTPDAKSSYILIEQPGSQSIDNYTYANVTNINYDRASKKLTLEGLHPSNCMKIKSVQIIANPDHDTFSLLPIISQVEPQCDRVDNPFTYEIILPEFDNKDILIHVRKMDGNALNYLINKSLFIK